MSLNMNGALAN